MDTPYHSLNIQNRMVNFDYIKSAITISLQISIIALIVPIYLDNQNIKNQLNVNSQQTQINTNSIQSILSSSSSISTLQQLVSAQQQLTSNQLNQINSISEVFNDAQPILANLNNLNNSYSELLFNINNKFRTFIISQTSFYGVYPIGSYAVPYSFSTFNISTFALNCWLCTYTTGGIDNLSCWITNNIGNILLNVETLGPTAFSTININTILSTSDLSNSWTIKCSSAYGRISTSNSCSSLLTINPITFGNNYNVITTK
jgi:hypothetical protein